MSEAIVKPELFDALLPHILKIGEGTYIEVSLPHNLEFDDNLVRQYFKKDVVATYTRDGHLLSRSIKGSLQNQEVFNYIKASLEKYEMTYGKRSFIQW